MHRALVVVATVALIACGGAQRGDPGDGDRKRLLAALDGESLAMETCASIEHDDLGYVCERLRANVVLCETAQLDRCYDHTAHVVDALRSPDWARTIADIADRERAREAEAEQAVDHL